MALPTPYSYRTYDGNGSTVTFAVPFPYIAREHVRVYINRNATTGEFESELAPGTGFTWPSDTLVTVTVPPPLGKTVTVARVTPIDSLVSVWQAGSPPTAAELTAADLQNLYAVQEYIDRVAITQDAIALVAGGAPLIQVIDNLTSTSQLAALSANQGRALKQLISEIEGTAGTTLTPLAFGAVGDGVTDDRAALKAALESGKVIDGGGLSYAINGTLQPTSFKGLRNATLIQIGNTTVSQAHTLRIEGISGFLVENVNINMGTNITTLFGDDVNSGLFVLGTQSGSGPGTTTTYVESFYISNVTVTGNGCGTGIHIRHAKRFSVVSCMVRDRVSGSSPDPTNDSQNGFHINNCANFTLDDCQAYNLRTRLAGVVTLKWTRGFLFAECRDFAVNNCIPTIADQGFDFSGSVIDGTSPSSYEGNRRFTLTGCAANNSGTWGFKFANVTHDGLIVGCIANNTTGSGFVCSSQEPAHPLANNSFRTQGLLFVGCKAVNCLPGGWADVTRAGFYVDTDSDGLYPRDIKFVGCSVEDNQAVPTTGYGFANNVPAINPLATDYNKNITISCKNCEVSGAAVHYQGIQFPGATLKGDANAGVTQTSEWTAVDLLGTEIYDASGLHSTSSNAAAAYIKESGLYLINATATFNANSTGNRKIQILRNGAPIGQEMRFPPHPTSYTRVFATAVLYLAQGDNIRFEIWQDSGNPLSYNRNDAFLSIARTA